MGYQQQTGITQGSLPPRRLKEDPCQSEPCAHCHTLQLIKKLQGHFQKEPDSVLSKIPMVLGAVGGTGESLRSQKGYQRKEVIQVDWDQVLNYYIPPKVSWDQQFHIENRTGAQRSKNKLSPPQRASGLGVGGGWAGQPMGSGR